MRHAGARQRVCARRAPNQDTAPQGLVENSELAARASVTSPPEIDPRAIAAPPPRTPGAHRNQRIADFAALAPRTPRVRGSQHPKRPRRPLREPSCPSEPAPHAERRASKYAKRRDPLSVPRLPANQSIARARSYHMTMVHHKLKSTKTMATLENSTRLQPLSLESAWSARTRT